MNDPVQQFWVGESVSLCGSAQRVSMNYRARLIAETISSGHGGGRVTTADKEVYAVGDWWVWRHRCPRGGWPFRQYHHTRERAVGQALRHRAACDAYIPFFPGADILMYISPDWAAWIPQWS